MQTDKALLIIDMQVGMLDDSIISPVFEANKLLSNVALLVETARRTTTPIIFAQHDGGSGHHLEYKSKGWHIHPDLKVSNEDLVIEKETPDSFLNTNLHEKLVSRNIKKLIIAGIQTEFCVDTTCRRAFSLDYEVTLVEDAHSTWDTSQQSASQIINHHNSTLSNWFVTLKSTKNCISEMDTG